MTAEEVLRKAGNMRKESRQYCSNAYFTMSQLKDLFESGQVQVLEDEDLIVLIQKDVDIYRLFFYALNDLALLKIQKLVPALDMPAILDVVGKDQLATELAQKLCCVGFDRYSVFARMICKNPLLPSGEKADAVELAQNSDLERIDCLLRGQFDPYFAHFPIKSELEEAIRKRQITVVRQRGAVAGFAWFEKVSERYTILRYFVVAPEYRRQNIGNALLYSQFSSAKPETIYMLWVGTYNEAQEIYQKLGFRRDGLTDYILKQEVYHERDL